MTAGARLLRFRCTRCGSCCRDVRVPLTDADLARLVLATGERPTEIVSWLSADEIDMSGEPETQVLDGATPRTMVLAQRREACVFFDEIQGCSAYEARPSACRTYPLVATFGRRGGVRRLRLLNGSEDACDFERDGRVDVRTLRADTERQARELESYARAVGAWNRRARQRARFHHAARSASDFIDWVLRPDHRSTSDTSPTDDNRPPLDPE